MPRSDKDSYNEYMREYMKEYSAKRRLKAIEVLGGCCAVCGSSEDLEIDHIDPATKSFTIAKGWHHAWSKILVELAKCQLLCNPCHIEKSRTDNGVEHGGGLTGKRNCRCDLCKPLKNRYANERRSH